MKKHWKYASFWLQKSLKNHTENTQEEHQISPKANKVDTWGSKRYAKSDLGGAEGAIFIGIYNAFWWYQKINRKS